MMTFAKRVTSATFVVLVAAGSLGLTGLAASASASNSIASQAYQQTNLVSDIPGLAVHTDPNLRNSWAPPPGPDCRSGYPTTPPGSPPCTTGRATPSPGRAASSSW